MSSNGAASIPSPNVTIAPTTADTLPAYRRLITLLLPIRYPDQFYKDSVANTTPSSLALCAIWNETLPNGKRKRETADSAQKRPEPKVVGGIQCRLEPLPVIPGPATSTPTLPDPTKDLPQQFALYIQTLATLSPYRSLGIATALLNSVVNAVLRHHSSSSLNSKVTEIYAHVWEANEEALMWYRQRGFEVEEGIVEGYYRKLRPSGARVVRRRVGVKDWIRAGKEEGIDGLGVGKDGE